MFEAFYCGSSFAVRSRCFHCVSKIPRRLQAQRPAIRPFTAGLFKCFRRIFNEKISRRSLVEVSSQIVHDRGYAISRGVTVRSFLIERAVVAKGAKSLGSDCTQ
ncbi:hypothetical protein Zmor_000162 [Zophobas morio]|uniref:Uncharacterized protein n=1 Tax=Zophobas morio TaxID=2755281 RepID=A0AA38IZH2_9CUCU|nr:hypothetical protein Zmor_000162 [Zophobas morio]